MHKQRPRYDKKDHQTAGETVPSKYLKRDEQGYRQDRSKTTSTLHNAVYDEDTG